MNLIKDKIFLGVVTFLLFISLSITLLQIDTHLILLYLLLLNGTIITGFFAFGWVAGGMLWLMASILSLYRYAGTGSSLPYICIAIFSMTYFIAYRYFRSLAMFQTEFLLKKQRIDEDINALRERIDKDHAHKEAALIKAKRFEALKSVTEYLSDIISRQEITKFFVKESMDIIGKSHRSLVYLIDPDSHALVLIQSKKAKHLPRIKDKEGDLFDKWVVRQNQPLIVLDASKDFRFAKDGKSLINLPFKSLISIPMISHNKVIGILRLDSLDANAYTPDDLRLLDIIGDLGAVALYNNMLYLQTTELAIRDGLTGLFLHRYFMERLESEIQRALAIGHPLGLLMIDIDNFKEYNDKYGHIAGDILLKSLSKIFSSIVGKGDIVGRYGGEEFAVILFDQTREDVLKLAEAIRKGVEREEFYLRRVKTSATVSIGTAFFGDKMRTRQELVKRADDNLYRAKREGKNRVCTD